MRKLLGMNKKSFSKQCGLDRSYFAGIERGERNLTFSNLCQICAGLNCDIAGVHPRWSGYRKAAGREVLSLYDEQRGSLPIPRDWTDQAVLSAGAGLIEPAPILDARCLLKLHDLVQTLTKRVDDE